MGYPASSRTPVTLMDSRPSTGGRDLERAFDAGEREGSEPAPDQLGIEPRLSRRAALPRPAQLK